MKELNLKKCPFCGGIGNIRKCVKAHKHYVRCSECGSETKRFLFDKDAVEAWNRRHNGQETIA